jgi:hypothetical protein
MLTNAYTRSTPLYQIIHHALSDPSNRTKFTLIYANVSPSDILLRKDLDDLKNKHPKHLDIVYLIDKSVEGWPGPTGYVTKELVKTYVGPKELGDKIKIFVCGSVVFLIGNNVSDWVCRATWTSRRRLWKKGWNETRRTWWNSQRTRIYRRSGEMNFFMNRFSRLISLPLGLQILEIC